MKARVIIVDDEPIVRAGLENWLSRSYEVVIFESSESLLNSFNQFELEDGLPTCILLDFQMTGLNGVELQQKLKLLNSKFPIIFMSGNAQQADIIDAWRGGAVDFILKPFTSAQVTEVLAKHFDDTKRAKIVESSRGEDDLIHIPITRREAEVLLLLGNGHQQAEVAKLLNISIRTVKMYRAFLKNKLGLDTLGELVKYCQRYESSIIEITKNTR